MTGDCEENLVAVELGYVRYGDGRGNVAVEFMISGL